MIWQPSPNFNERPAGRPVDMLVLHYTGMVSAAAALARMTDPAAAVSAHYMIDEDGAIFALVAEDQRAWHAGVASWAGEHDINGLSLGIELVNPGHAYPGYAGGYRAFPARQMTALVWLMRDILSRHAIPPARILAHSDVAPERKIDPGELFDWEWLAQQGLGLMPRRGLSAVPDVRRLQADLARFGYGIEVTGTYDAATERVVAAFQRHYRRARVDGVADSETAAALADLLRQAGL